MLASERAFVLARHKSDFHAESYEPYHTIHYTIQSYANILHEDKPVHLNVLENIRQDPGKAYARHRE